MDVTDPGLCKSCRFRAVVRTSRGRDFWRCRRAETDPKFRKYPRIPVEACSGYEPDDGDPSPLSIIGRG